MRARTLASVAFVAVAGCAHAHPPQELVDARATYQQVSRGPASKVERDQLAAAKKELARAESAFKDHGDAPATKDAAYLAIRKAQLADAAAKTAVAIQDRETAEHAAVVAQANAFEETRTELERVRKTRAGSDQCERQALEDLQRVAWIKREDRGIVITLSGSVAFGRGGRTLGRASVARLERVAVALNRATPEATVVIEGYTDASGSVERNEALSLARAQAVADLLVARGVASSRITVQGLGPERPIADNHTAEGRAQNRRVEIVVNQQE